MTEITPKKHILVDGRRMAYVERGQGVPLRRSASGPQAD